MTPRAYRDLRRRLSRLLQLSRKARVAAGRAAK